MVRYLMRLSYLGTKFSGSQRQTSYSDKNPRLNTVQSVVENALSQTLKPKNEPMVVAAGRTDTGVHAFCAPNHVDLHHPVAGKFFTADIVTLALNKYMVEEGHAIRVAKTQIVPEDFHSRYRARRRSYVYRIAVVRENRFPKVADMDLMGDVLSMSYAPLLESSLCHIVYPPFDQQALINGSRLFHGTFNFTTFCKPLSARDRETKPPRDPVRPMACEISPGQGSLSHLDPFQRHLEFWDITFHSSGYLWRQIRRMVGTLVALAKGEITEDTVRFMLNNPDSSNWPSKIRIAPPDGLFLKDVQYDEEDLILPVDYFDAIVKNKASYTYLKITEVGRLCRTLSGRITQLSS